MDVSKFKTFLLGWTFILLDKFRRRAGHHGLYIFAVRCYIVSSLSVDVTFFSTHRQKGFTRSNYKLSTKVFVEIFYVTQLR